MSGFHPYGAVLRQQLEERQGSVDLILLEAAYNDEIKCQMTHAGGSVCGVDVTHRMVFCADAINICAQAAASKEREKEKRTHRCARCRRPAEDCWKILPV